MAGPGVLEGSRGRGRLRVHPRLLRDDEIADVLAKSRDVFPETIGRDGLEHVDDAVGASVEEETVLGKRPRRTGDGDGEHGAALLDRETEGAVAKFLYRAVGGAGSFGKEKDRDTAIDPSAAGLHQTLRAPWVAAGDARVAVEPHVPADEREVEHAPFGDPLERAVEAEQDEDVAEGLVVTDDDEPAAPGDTIAVLDAQRPERVAVEVELRPEARVEVLDPAVGIEGKRRQESYNGAGEEDQRRDAEERPEERGVGDALEALTSRVRLVLS